MMQRPARNSTLHFTVAMAFLLLLPAVLGSVPSKKMKTKKLSWEDSIRATLQEQIEAWNVGDLDKFCDIYTPDATFLSPGGVTQGREQVRARYAKRYGTPAEMGTLSLEIREILPSPGPVARNAPPYAASVAARWTLSYPDRDPLSGWTLLVMHRLGDRWFIAQDASMGEE